MQTLQRDQLYKYDWRRLLCRELVKYCLTNKRLCAMKIAKGKTLKHCHYKRRCTHVQAIRTRMCKPTGRACASQQDEHVRADRARMCKPIEGTCAISLKFSLSFSISSALISTEGALSLLTTYDHPTQSHPSTYSCENDLSIEDPI